MMSFTVLTDTPARLRNFLISRGVVEEKVVATPEGGQETIYVGTLPGMEWVEVPNKIVTDNSDPDNPVYDTRRVFLVKFAHESEDEDADGDLVDAEGNPINQYDRTKFGKWVKANSTVVTAPANYTINGEPVGDAYKVNGQNVWLVKANPERFGVWQ